MRRGATLAGAFAALMLCAGAAQAAPNLVQNGSFENGNYTGSNPGCECDMESGSGKANDITAWTIVAPPGKSVGSIDWLDNFPTLPPSDGNFSLDVSGNFNGAIEQTVPTVPGASYVLTFDESANWQGPPMVKELGVKVGTNPTVDFAHASTNPISYDHNSLPFTATSSWTTIEFFTDQDPNNTPYGPLLDNVALRLGVPHNEDQCEGGNYSSLSNGNGMAFMSQAACDAFATNTTLASTLPNGQCSNVTFTGNASGDVTVPKGTTCVLAPGATVGHDLKVLQGATLYDEGATVGHDLQADKANGVDLDSGSAVRHDVQIQGLTGVPAGENADELCGTTVGHDMSVQNGGPGAPTDVGCSTDGEGGNTVGHDLTVQNNAAPVSVENNTVGHDMTVQNNRPGGATIGGNSWGHDGKCRNNVGPDGCTTAGGGGGSI